MEAKKNYRVDGWIIEVPHRIGKKPIFLDWTFAWNRSECVRLCSEKWSETAEMLWKQGFKPVKVHLVPGWLNEALEEE